MLLIKRMRIRLPAGYEHRASGIAQLVGDSLASYQADENHSIESLSIGPLQIGLNSTDQEIADNIANRITSRLGDGI